MVGGGERRYLRAACDVLSYVEEHELIEAIALREAEMLNHHERIADAMHRPGMYGICTLQQAIYFFQGFDAATEFAFLPGFAEWLSQNGGIGENIAWPHQAEKVVAARAAKQADEVEELFALVREFLAEARQLTLPPPPPRRFFSQERAGAEER